MSFAAFAVSLLALAACGGRGCWNERAAGSAPPPSSSPIADTPRGASSAPEAPTEATSAGADDELSTRPVELLKFQWTSAVKNREPTNRLVLVHPGERVYAHLTIRNRTGRPRKLHLAFHVNGKERTSVDLDIAESWSYRTWAYDTVLKTDKPGELSLEIVDDEGQPIDDEKLPIVARQ